MIQLEKRERNLVKQMYAAIIDNPVKSFMEIVRPRTIS